MPLPGSGPHPSVETSAGSRDLKRIPSGVVEWNFKVLPSATSDNVTPSLHSIRVRMPRALHASIGKAKGVVSGTVRTCASPVGDRFRLARTVSAFLRIVGLREAFI